MESEFKEKYGFALRRGEAVRIRKKYPDRIPIIVEKIKGSDIPDLDKNKYLAPADMTIGYFIYIIRRRLDIGAEKGIFLFVNNTLPPVSAVLSSIYEDNKEDDLFLYFFIGGEQCFG